MGRKAVYICSIDIGITNLGISLSKVRLCPSFQLVKVIRCQTFDLTRITAMVCTKINCEQYGDRSFSHHVRHFVEEQREHYFDPACMILIERQPRTVFTAVEQILNYIFPRKTLLQSPMTLHAWMGTIGLSRAQKKAESLRRALPYIEHLPGFKKHRSWRHDMADSVVYLVMYLEKEKEKYYGQIGQNQFKEYAFQPSCYF